MGGPRSGRREGNPAENRKKKAKDASIEFRCWQWQKDIIKALAEKEGLTMSDFLLIKAEVIMKHQFTYDETKKTTTITTGREVGPNGPDYSKGYNAYPGEIDGKEAIQIFSPADHKWYLEMVKEEKIYEIL